jgi:hypothetical protein
VTSLTTTLSVSFELLCMRPTLGSLGRSLLGTCEWN